MLDLVINSSITHSLLVALPVGCALLLRQVRCPGWPVVAGAVAGILLGPTIYGRVAPESFEKHFVGAAEQRATRDTVLRSRQAELEAAAEARLDRQAMDEIRSRHEPAIARSEAAWEEAKWKFQRPFRSYTSAVVVLCLIGAGVLQVRARDERQGLVAPVSIGLWSACLPGGAAAVAVIWMLGSTRAEAALTGAAVAIGPWILTAVDRSAADSAEHGGAHMIQRAGRVASIVALIAAAAALTTQRGATGLLWFAPLATIAIGWCVPPIAHAKIVRALLEFAVVPSLAACVAIRVELFEHFSFWLLLVLALLSGDGRWLGAFLGAILPGARRGLRTMRLVLGSTAAGPTQLAVAGVAANTGGVPGSVLLGLLVGAIVVEVTTPARRSLARRLTEAEAAMEELDRMD